MAPAETSQHAPQRAAEGTGPDVFARVEAGALGMWIFLVALGVLFAASIVGYVVIRINAQQAGEPWPPAGAVDLPDTLWLSTLIIIVSSVTMQAALEAVRRNWRRTLPIALIVTSLLGLLFLGLQVDAWRDIDVPAVAPATTPISAYEVSPEARTRFYYGMFIILSGLHALHVVGGLIPLGVVTVKALRGAYGSAKRSGVSYTTMYWHFLGAVWIVLFAVLYLTNN